MANQHLQMLAPIGQVVHLHKVEVRHAPFAPRVPDLLAAVSTGRCPNLVGCEHRRVSELRPYMGEESITARPWPTVSWESPLCDCSRNGERWFAIDSPLEEAGCEPAVPPG